MITLEELKKSNDIIFSCVSGSHAYGLNTEKSDIDERGIYLLDREEYLKLTPTQPQISNDSQDIIYYCLKRYLHIASQCNPNILELLWIDENDILFKDGRYDILRKNRNLFISKGCFNSFSGYAYCQIKRARGQNKNINNPWPRERPSYIDYCGFIDFMAYAQYIEGYDQKTMPGRPIPIRKTNVDLSRCHAAKLEHVNWGWRLYNYPEKSKGVFRGTEKDGYKIIPESIPISEEWSRFAGILIFNEDEYKSDLVKHKQYWEWIENRNDSRWISQEKGEMDFDGKNIMHCFRLLFSCKNILTNGEPIVKFSGQDRDFLMKIRSVEFKYDYLIKLCEEKMAELEEINKGTKIPDSVYSEKVDQLFLNIINN